MSEQTPQFFLYDSMLLNLAFYPYSLGTCALIKNNTLSIFMLSGSIQFSISISVQYKSCIYQNNAFIQCLV